MPLMHEGFIKAHIRANLLRYIIITVTFIVGIIAGAYIATTYGQDDVKQVVAFLDDFFKIFKGESTNYNQIFKTSLLESVKTISIIWILGFTIIGVLGIIIMVFKRGFLIGFMSGFIIKIYFLKGIAISFIVLLAQSLIFIPVLFLVSVFGLQLSGLLIRMVSGRIKYKTDVKGFILNYSFLLILSIIVLCIYAFFEAYVCSSLLKWVIGLN